MAYTAKVDSYGVPLLTLHPIDFLLISFSFVILLMCPPKLFFNARFSLKYLRAETSEL